MLRPASAEKTTRDTRPPTTNTRRNRSDTVRAASHSLGRVHVTNSRRSIRTGEEADRGPAPTRVLIASSRPVARVGLALTLQLEPGIDLVAVVADQATAVATLQAQQPAVAVVDVASPAVDAALIVQAIAERGLPIEVILLAQSSRAIDVLDAVEAGATGYVLESEPVSMICHAIRTVARGERFLSHRAEQALIDLLRSRGTGQGARLTARELAVIRLVAAGKSTREIAAELNLSEATIRHHRGHIYAKLGVTKAAAAVYQAVGRGVLQWDGVGRTLRDAPATGRARAG